MADSEFDAQMTRLDQRIAAMNRRLDAMANVNEHLIADGWPGVAHRLNDGPC